MLKSIVGLLLMVMMQAGQAETLLEYLTDAEGRYTGPTVEEKVAEMDTDKNGFADVYEVRAYLEKVHGADYQKDVIARWVAKANPNSCGTTTYTNEFLANQ